MLKRTLCIFLLMIFSMHALADYEICPSFKEVINLDRRGAVTVNSVNGYIEETDFGGLEDSINGQNKLVRKFSPDENAMRCKYYFHTPELRIVTMMKYVSGWHSIASEDLGLLSQVLPKTPLKCETQLNTPEVCKLFVTPYETYENFPGSERA